MTSSPRAVDSLRRLLALLVVLTGVGGVPAGLWQLGGRYLPDQLPSWPQVTAALSGPDTGAVFLGLLVVIGWAAWAIFALSVAVELPAQLRGAPPLRLPGLSGPQQLAGLLVAAILGVGGAPLLASPALAAPSMVAESPTQNAPSGLTPAPASNPQPPAPRVTGPTYTVQPRDTLGRIAARTVGDWSRFEEILALNRGRPQPDGGTLTAPGLIRPGWVLVLPADATLPADQPTADQVIVQPGDTLTDIAEQHGLDSWQPIFQLSAGEPEPGGGRFTDPNLIRPGQVLDLPAATAEPPEESEPSPSEPPRPLPPDGPGPATSLPAPAGRPTPPPGQEEPTSATHSPEPAAGDLATSAAQPSGGLAAVLAGSGALLAAGLGTAWAAHRRQRLRRRQPGRRLTPPPPELSTTQAALTRAADAGKADYAALDLALRGLAVLLSDNPEGQLPDVIAARLAGHRLLLRLHTPADRPPPPWTVDDGGHRWSVDLAAATAAVDPVRAKGRLAPYPTLVTIGHDGDQRWLLDLERIGLLLLRGSPARREDFARHLAAELAVNSWSDLLTVTTVGFGGELIDLAPDRLHPVDTLSTAQLQTEPPKAADAGDGVLEGRLHATAGDGWMPHVILAPQVRDEDDLIGSIAALRARTERSATAAVLAAPEATSAQVDGPCWVLTLTDEGLLLVPDLDLRLPAQQLTAGQARDIAALLAFERDAGDAPIPDAQGDRPWQASTDAAGALRDDLSPRPDLGPAPDPTQSRPAAPTPSELAGPGSAPSTDSGRLGPAAAADGVHAVSRRDPGFLRQRLEADLEQLDRDLADWWSTDCTRPRLTLLGPVTVRAHGDQQAPAKSGLRRRYEEAIAYLATRPHGATVEETAAALQPVGGGKSDPINGRAYVHRVTAGARAWLGTDSFTGEKHLSPGHHGRYLLRNVLIDADLFRQLRARASVRGPEGMPDLQAALELVTGAPFAQHPAGYEWLAGLDLTYTAAICDVAHQVITTALADDDIAHGDRDAARAASATALLVAPDDETVLLDAMRVAFHEGNRAEADTYIARIVAVHDGEDEMDLPLSTAETINRARRQHLDRAS